MKKNLTTVAFSETPEQAAKLEEVIASHKGQKGALMPILQDAQAIYGYLPREIQRRIALAMEIPEEEIYGVTTFYSQFTLNPKGKYSISVCLGTACYVKGAGALIDKVSEVLGVPVGATSSDGIYSVDATRCLGACGLAPVMVINDEVYGRLSPSDIPGIIAKYK